MPTKPVPRPNTTRRVRLKGFDYRTPGYYFITICQQDRRHLFSRVANRTNRLHDAGEMLDKAVREIEIHFRNTTADAFVVMPNHVHVLLGMNLSENHADCDNVTDVIGWWKTVTTKRYIEGVIRYGWPRFNGRLWQEGYHDRIRTGLYPTLHRTESGEMG